MTAGTLDSLSPHWPRTDSCVHQGKAGIVKFKAIHVMIVQCLTNQKVLGSISSVHSQTCKHP